MEQKLTIENVDWHLARIVVKEEKPEWEEDFDEAEGDFLGWIKVKNGNVVTFNEFLKWWGTKI